MGIGNELFYCTSYYRSLLFVMFELIKAQEGLANNDTAYDECDSAFNAWRNVELCCYKQCCEETDDKR